MCSSRTGQFCVISILNAHGVQSSVYVLLVPSVVGHSYTIRRVRKYLIAYCCAGISVTF